MGWYIVPDLTDEQVVCQKPCAHKDCMANRAEWTDAKCCDCSKPLTAGMAFYFKQVKPEILHQCVECALKEAA